MAVGGMVGGGIFSTLGVVIGIAGEWAWLSFVGAGLVALGAGYAYTKLASHYNVTGGAFAYLTEQGLPSFAGSLAWVLIVGYVLTNAVYAFTFGQYLAHVFGMGQWFARAAAVAILGFFTWLNLRGVGEAGGVEVVLVWFKMAVLVGLAAWGLSRWQPSLLSRGAPHAGVGAIFFGASSVFMAYEGFQLLAYDVDDIADPRKTLPRAVLGAIAVVIVTYALVATGTAMLIGADQIMAHQEVALAVAGKEAAGLAGLIVVTVAAAFSTGSAINSTLFATARLSHVVAKQRQLPAWIDHQNARHMPDRAVIGLGASAAALAVIGTLGILVESASLAFLATFTVVCALAFRVRAGHRVFTGIAALLAFAATIALAVHLALDDPRPLGALAGLVLVAIFVRPRILALTNGREVSDRSQTQRDQ